MNGTWGTKRRGELKKARNRLTWRWRRSPEDVSARLDRLIQDIRDRWHRPVIDNKEAPNGDVLVVAHGHILRAFAMRWAGKTLQDGPAFLLEAGGVGTLR